MWSSTGTMDEWITSTRKILPMGSDVCGDIVFSILLIVCHRYPGKHDPQLNMVFDSFSFYIYIHVDVVTVYFYSILCIVLNI